MLVIRSLAFNVAFYANLIVQMIVFTPYYFLAPRHAAWFVPKFWARSSLKLQEWIAGTKSQIDGLENILSRLHKAATGSDLPTTGAPARGIPAKAQAGSSSAAGSRMRRSTR